MRKSLSAALLGLAFAGTAMSARADVDSPGSLMFDFLAEEQTVYSSFVEVPGDAPFTRAVTRAVFFSTDASSFGEGGVLIWAGFDLEGDPEGPRYGMLLIDLDLGQAPSHDDIPMPASAVRAEYLEKRGDEILFDGQPKAGYVWIVDIVFHEDDKGGVEGEFEFIFTDPDLEEGGCRVFLEGMFITDPSPAQLRQQYGYVGSDDEYVGVGCTGGVSVTDEDPGCGGEDPGAGGCEGDTGGEAGCEGDTGGGGCEGDAGGASDCSGCGDAGSGCGEAAGSGCGEAAGSGCGAAAGGACAGAANAAALRPRRSGGPLWACMRLLPQISVLLFIIITWMRSRYRR